MKKTAVLIYDQFCNFEISVVLEILTLKEKPITIFAQDLSAIKSEDGLTVLPDQCIDDIDINEYDSLLLPGAMNIDEIIKSEKILSFIQLFDAHQKIIGAISIAPILLVKSGVMKDKPFMAGINHEDLYEEDFSRQDLTYMHGWNDNLTNPIEQGYMISGNIITSISYNFIYFAIGFTKMLGLDYDARWFGIRQ